MALTKVAPAGIGSTPGDGYRIGLSFLHSTGVELTNANASGIVTAAQFDGKLNIGIATFTDDVKFTGAAANVTWDKSGDDLIFDDSAKAVFGTSSDGLEIYHASNNSHIIEQGTGGLIVSSSLFSVKNAAANEDMIKATPDGSVASYYNNVKRLETSGIGVTVTGQLDVGNVSSTGVITATKFVGDIAVGSSITYADNELAYFGTDLDGSIKHTGTNFQILETTGGLQITNYANDQDVDIRSDDGSGGTALYFRADGSTGEAILSHYGNEKIKTTSTGVSITGNISAAQGHFTDHIYIADKIVHTGDTNTWLRFPSNDTIAFGTGGTTKLQISSDGRVGIGEDAPDSLLHIKANNDRACIRLENTYDTPDNVWEIQPGISGVSNTGFCIRDITDSANRLVINGSGIIGVGVNDPAVAGGYGGMEIGGSANTGLRLSATSAGGWAFTDYEINGSQKFIVGCKGGDSTWRISTGVSLDSNIKLVVDSYGRLGLGLVPESFHANSKGVIRGDSGYAILGRSNNQLNISQNFYYDSSDAGKYIATGEASLYSQVDGAHEFYSAASGSANASASMQEKLQIQTDGNINFKSTNEPTIRIDSGNSSNSSCLKIEIDGTEEFRIEPGIIDYKNSSNTSRSRLLAANNYYNNTNLFIDLTQWRLSDSWNILEVFGTVNPNSSGSGAYVDPVHMYIYRGIGWNSGIKHFIYSVHVAPPARQAFPGGSGMSGNSGVSAVWYTGSTIRGNKSATSTDYIRLNIPNANGSANFQKNFRVMRRF